MEFGFTTAAYVVSQQFSSSCRLGGLSDQESAKRAVWYGIVGMALAVSATLIGPGSGLVAALNCSSSRQARVIGYLCWRPGVRDDPDAGAWWPVCTALVGLAAVFVGFIAHFEIGNVARAFADAGFTSGINKAAIEAAGQDPTEAMVRLKEMMDGFGTFAALIAKKDACRDQHSTGRAVPWCLHRGDYIHWLGHRLSVSYRAK